MVCRVLRLVDIGGGRGDLALAIGACLADSLGGRLEVQVQVLVLDINPRSLEQVRFEFPGKKEFEEIDVF
jgi:ubiquinone/menaquinone biosynthesis C-methylase UbiE